MENNRKSDEVTPNTKKVLLSNSEESSKELTDLRERLTITEIKVNDCEQRLSILLRSKRGAAKRNQIQGQEEDNT